MRADSSSDTHRRAGQAGFFCTQDWACSYFRRLRDMTQPTEPSVSPRLSQLGYKCTNFNSAFNCRGCSARIVIVDGVILDFLQVGQCSSLRRKGLVLTFLHPQSCSLSLRSGPGAALLRRAALTWTSPDVASTPIDPSRRISSLGWLCFSDFPEPEVHSQT